MPTSAAERGRYATGAGGVGADADVRDAERHRDRRPGARPAGDALGERRVPDRAVRAADADEPGGELVEVGLAEHHGARVDQRLDRRARSTAAGPGRPAGSVAYDGHAAVVGSPATSMLSLTATVTPASGSTAPAASRASTARAAASAVGLGSSVIQTSGRSTSAIRA